MQFSYNYSTNSAAVEKLLQPDKSFDIIRRELKIGGRSAVLYFIDGYLKDEMFEKILEFLLKITPEQLCTVQNATDFAKSFLPYVEAQAETDVKKAATAVLAGQSLLIIDGIKNAIMTDAREYPVRSVSEPDKDRSLRGSRDGFVETLIFNTAMLRRRIRDPKLRVEHMQLGTLSHTDVALCYIDGSADSTVVEKLKKRLEKTELDGISMTAEAIAEKLAPTAFFNPFPKIRYTERPDFASACVLEGKIALVMDNSPVVMLFPTCFADFSREADDYCFSRLSGTYIRTLRVVISVLTVILTPLVLLFTQRPQLLPDFLKFIIPESGAALPIFAQLLALEFVIDGLRLASLNTPDTLSSSLGIIGGLVLSEFAVSAGWFQKEAILYMSFVAIASYTQPTYEMGYAMKFVRIFLLLCVRLLNIYGLLLGAVLVIITMLCTKTVSGRGYFYPVIPFCARNFAKLFVRTKITK